MVPTGHINMNIVLSVEEFARKFIYNIKLNTFGLGKSLFIMTHKLNFTLSRKLYQILLLCMYIIPIWNLLFQYKITYCI
jgi:hypothetical protein